jgi:hypothetical protein
VFARNVPLQSRFDRINIDLHSLHHIPKPHHPPSGRKVARGCGCGRKFRQTYGHQMLLLLIMLLVMLVMLLMLVLLVMLLIMIRPVSGGTTWEATLDAIVVRTDAGLRDGPREGAFSTSSTAGFVNRWFEGHVQSTGTFLDRSIWTVDRSNIG